jgi:glycosyltransferase involved in cell wall biosynthesis
MSQAVSGSDCLPVTVVIPAFNAAATLPRALASVFAQTCLPAEIVVVDDASQDHTWEFLQTFGNHPLPIRTLRLACNGGVAAARNAGWAMASQEYVAFLDADDAWHPRKLEIQYRWMIDHPRVVLCGHRCEVAGSPAAAESPTDDLPVRHYGLASFLVTNRLSTPTVMLRRSLDERFAGGKRYSEDYLLWMQIVAAHGPAGFIDLPLALLFKARYGSSGLSGDLWGSQWGEIDSFSRLRRASIIGIGTWLGAVAWSWVKFTRRAIYLFLFGSALRRDVGHDPS